MKRLNKEYKLDVCNHVIVKYGSVNKDNPQVIYISGRCWVSPKVNIDYDYVISNIEKEMRKNIKLFLMDGVNFDKKFILDFDINTDNFGIGDKKFLSFDFYLRQNEANKKSLKDLKNILNGRISTVVNNLVYLFKENDFTIEKRK
jgi:hypothetical protein